MIEFLTWLKETGTDVWIYGLMDANKILTGLVISTVAWWIKTSKSKHDDAWWEAVTGRSKKTGEPKVDPPM